MESPLLDYSAGAEYLTTTERHLRYLVTERKIPVTRVGRKIRFSRVELDRWLADRTVREAG